MTNADDKLTPSGMTVGEVKRKLVEMKELRERLIDKDLTQEEKDTRAKCEQSLSMFLRHAWKYIDPAPYIGNWHIDCVCEHLEAVVRGELRHLLINQPPRTAKSSSVAVALVPWIWAQREIGPLSGPPTSALYASYAQTLSFRDSNKARRLLMSPWYQRLWGSRFNITTDQNTKSRFDNNKGGYRIATSVGGALTGEGAQLIVADDVHNSIEAESELIRQSVLDWWDQALSTRLNDPKTGAYVVVMQRLNEDDLAGHILSNASDDWTHISLPMRYESERHCSTPIFDDPRTMEGELLWPERFGEREVKALEVALGPYGSAGQLQQRPSPKGGGIIKQEWFQLWENKDEYPPFEYIVAYLDTAYTEKQENDYSALVVLGVFRDKNNLPKIMIIYAWRDRLELNGLVTKAQQICKRFKVDKLLIEDKAAGHSVAQELRRLFGSMEFSIQLDNPKGQDKVARTYSVQHLFAEGMIYAPDKSWVDTLIQEVTTFPKAKHDDLCFIAGTKIATQRGPVSIENLKLDEKVLTPDGWKTIINCEYTGFSKVISKFGLVGTPMHPVFLIDSSYQPMHTINSENKLLRLNLCGMMRIALLKSLSSMEGYSVEWEESVNTIYRNQEVMTEENPLKVFMSLFGNFIQKRKFRKAFTFTIKTVTHLIILLKIYNVYLRTNTEGFLKTLILKKCENTWLQFDHWPACGINLKEDVNGIKSMLKIPYLKLLNLLNIFVVVVEKSLSLEKQKALNTVLAHAPGNFYTKKTTQIQDRDKLHVSNVEKIFIQKCEEELNFAEGLVANVTAKENEERIEKVYNLSVEGAHCYFANGILVHNCDSLVGGLRHLRDSGWALRKEENDYVVAKDHGPYKKEEALYDV